MPVPVLPDTVHPFPRGLFRLWGKISEIGPVLVKVSGVSDFARVGAEIRIGKLENAVIGEILNVSGTSVTAVIYSGHNRIRIGDVAFVEQEASVVVGDHWLGRIIDFRGIPSGQERSIVSLHGSKRPLHQPALPADLRSGLGSRLSTGLMVTDTLLPICVGQRVGLFAGSGVGKSTLLAKLVQGIEADRVVIGLIGERSREVNEFARRALTNSAISKTTIVAATASESPGAKKRAAYCAMAAAEYFREQGHNTLLILDSLTRFAEAHREVALMCGEAPGVNAFPPSTMRVIAELVERAGPGIKGSGNITGIFSVLVAGSDMEEPVADMIRGVLDGHIILSRDIAERGRYPAIDVLRSVSRALPEAASEQENALLKDYKQLVALRDEVAPMLRANLYEFGNDVETDRAISLFQELDKFAGSENAGDTATAFTSLKSVLSRHPPIQDGIKATTSNEAAKKEILTGGATDPSQ